jgi:hypothetical protein
LQFVLPFSREINFAMNFDAEPGAGLKSEEGFKKKHPTARRQKTAA